MTRADDDLGRLAVLVLGLLLASLVLVEPIAAKPQTQREICSRRSVPSPGRRLEPDLDLVRAGHFAENESSEHDEIERRVVLAGRDPDNDEPRGVETRRRKNVQRGSLRAAKVGRLGGGANQRLKISELRGHRRGGLHVGSDEYDERAPLGRGQRTKGDLHGSAHVRMVPKSLWTPQSPDAFRLSDKGSHIGGFAAPVNKSPRLPGTNLIERRHSAGRALALRTGNVLKRRWPHAHPCGERNPRPARRRR
jgi:hypothetical protein